jgi:mRNA interferase RelE/StbE
MTYKLEFRPTAEKAWRKLGSTVREQLRKKLDERLGRPRVPKDALQGFPDHYKIKLKDAGYRLVYYVEDQTVTVLVVSIGKRERSEAYRKIPQAPRG